MKALENTSFPEQAQRINALYNEEEDALMLGMLGQEYVIRRIGVFLHGQHAPESHTAVILDYLFSAGDRVVQMPWRSLGDFAGKTVPEFRGSVELPIAAFASDIVARTGTLLPMLDAQVAPSLIGSELAVVIRALPKVYLRLEISQETQDFPAEAWLLFSNNAQEFLTLQSLQALAELFKERFLSLIRIY